MFRLWLLSLRLMPEYFILDNKGSESLFLWGFHCKISLAWGSTWLIQGISVYPGNVSIFRSVPRHSQPPNANYKPGVTICTYKQFILWTKRNPKLRDNCCSVFIFYVAFLFIYIFFLFQIASLQLCISAVGTWSFRETVFFYNPLLQYIL